jgi:hypothetical protein
VAGIVAHANLSICCRSTGLDAIPTNARLESQSSSTWLRRRNV